MFGWLFGRKKKSEEIEYSPEDEAADTAFYEAKQAALERTLGPMEDTVLHSIIPFAMGGALDLYYFTKCIPGTVFATQELIMREKSDRPRPNKLGYFELVACIPPGADRSDEKQTSFIHQILNPIANYASQAKVNPNETAEIPGDDGEPSLPLIFDRFDPKHVPFEFNNEKFHLLLCIAVHHSELAYARENSTQDLIKLLQGAGVYPYSNLDRPAVV